MLRLHRRRGFSLVELLIVIAIIAVLVAMLLPAIQKVRESSARATSTNNLRQLALAANDHLATQGRYPTANYDCFDYNDRTVSWQGLPGWKSGGVTGSEFFCLFPYLELTPIYEPTLGTLHVKRITDTGVSITLPDYYSWPRDTKYQAYQAWRTSLTPGDADTNFTGAAPVIRTFVAPLDPTAFPTLPLDPYGVAMSPVSYLYNFGAYDSTLGFQQPNPYNTSPKKVRNAADIINGTTQLLMFAEAYSSCVDSNAHTTRGGWNWDPTVIRETVSYIPTWPPYLDTVHGSIQIRPEPGACRISDVQTFTKGGSLQIALYDGSVRTLSSQAYGRIYKILSANKEAVLLDDEW